MINPIVIIITISFILSVLAVCVINKHKKPLMTAAMILTFIFYIIVTFIIDSAITSTVNEQFSNFVKFLVMSDTPTYDELAESFGSFMKMDILLVIVTLISMFTEIVLIFRKESKR